MSRTHRTLRAVGVAVLAALLASAAAAPAAAGEGSQGSVGIGLLEVPTDRADDPRALVYVIDHLHPGDVIERRIEVTNSTANAVDVDLYPAAAEIGDRGWTPLDGRAVNDLTSWTTITPSSGVVPSGGRLEGTIRVVVPDDARPGEHYAVAWAQLPVDSGGTVDVINRVGLRLYLSVGDGREPASDFAIRSAQAVTTDDGHHRLDVSVENTGGRAIDVNGEVVLAGPAGLTAGPFRSPTGPTIAPGSDDILSLAVPDDLPDGTWRAQIVVRSGTLERRAELPVSWSDPAAGFAEADRAAVDPPAPLGVETSDGSFGDVGTLVASMLAALLILAVAAAALRTHRRQRSAAEIAVVAAAQR